MPIRKTISLNEFNKKNDAEKFTAFLVSHINKVPYSVMGVMIDCFGVSESTITNKSFSKWKTKHCTLYSRITKWFAKLVKSGMVRKNKIEGTNYYLLIKKEPEW